MTDDYLYDRSGHDPEVVALERLLAPYAHRAPLRAPGAPHRTRRRRYAIALATAAVLAAALALVVLRPARPTTPDAALAPCTGAGAGFAFSVQGGEARCAGTAVTAGTLPVGAWLETHGPSRTSLAVADIGALEVFGDARLRLVRTGAAEHRLELARGRISASVVAPPRLFVIDTPSAEAVDFGCAYELEVDADGRTHLRVTSGEVSLEGKGGRVAYVPAGTEVIATRAHGPGTPVAVDASPQVRAAVARVDAGEDPAALSALLDVVGYADVITVWNLVARSRGEARRAVVTTLHRLLPRPADVAEADVLVGDPTALERWRQAIVDDWFGPPR